MGYIIKCTTKKSRNVQQSQWYFSFKWKYSINVRLFYTVYNNVQTTKTLLNLYLRGSQKIVIKTIHYNMTITDILPRYKERNENSVLLLKLYYKL